jgi:C-5 cytosine-specific DNA methylase
VSRIRVIDLCSGRGGWIDGFRASGWQTVAVDVVKFKDNRADRFIVADIRKPFRLPGADLVVASPPCQEFSKADSPGLYPKLSRPSLELVDACFGIARALGCPLVLENVRGLQKFLGQAVNHYGPFYLWGDGVPVLMPYTPGRAGRVRFKWQHRSPSLRAKIPYELAYWIAEYHRSRLSSGRSAQGYPDRTGQVLV